jgi:hypothetical protein
VISQHDRFDDAEPGQQLKHEGRAGHARAPVRPDATVLVVDEQAAESVTAPGDEIERLFAAASAIWCLPQGRAGPGPEPAGTLIRPAAVPGLARRAGYAGGQILPAGDPVGRFCRLVP